MALILLLVVVADSLVVLFVRKPLPWMVMISALIPLLTCILVILPLTRDEKPAPPSV